MVKITSQCTLLMNRKSCSIRQLAELIGTLVASEPGVELAPHFYRRLESEKSAALKKAKGNFETDMTLSATIK